jgi:uncharacterized membrane protein
MNGQYWEIAFNVIIAIVVLVITIVVLGAIIGSVGYYFAEKIKWKKKRREIQREQDKR